MSARERLTPIFLLILLLVAPATSWGEDHPRERVPHNDDFVRAELTEFPFNGLGDAVHSFHHPFTPSSRDTIAHWRQAGTATAASSRDGRDVVKLTPPSQGAQGLIYNVAHTGTNNFNGYVDLKIGSSPQSKYPADGMGIFFSRGIPKRGSAMGMNDKFVGLGIIIDTYANTKKRRVPYMYAYISDGKKEWNPSTDGADTEIAPGCNIEMDKVVRVYVRYVHETLHVAYSTSLTAKNSQWRTCFIKQNVQLPFNSGGYLSVAAETGYYFSTHEVYGAQFVVDEEYWDEEEYDDFYEDHDPRIQREAENRGRDGIEYSKSNQEGQSRSDPREHHANELLSGAIDANMRDLREQLISQISRVSSGLSPTDRERMDAVKSVSIQLAEEVGRQTSQMDVVVADIQSIRQIIEQLKSVSDKFSMDVQKLEGTLQTLHYSSDDLKNLQEESHRELGRGTKMLKKRAKEIRKSSEGGTSMIFLFIIAQGMIMATAYVIVKMGSPTSQARYDVQGVAVLAKGF